MSDLKPMRAKAEIWATRDGDFTPKIFPATQDGLQAAIDYSTAPGRAIDVAAIRAVTDFLDGFVDDRTKECAAALRKAIGDA